MDAADAQRSTGDSKLSGLVNLAVIHVERFGHTPFENAHLEHTFHARHGFFQEEFCMGHQAAVVIDKAEQVRPAFLAWQASIGQPWTKHHVTLPERIDMLTFEALIGAWLLGQESARLAAGAQMAGQGMRIGDLF